MNTRLDKIVNSIRSKKHEIRSKTCDNEYYKGVYDGLKYTEETIEESCSKYSLVDTISVQFYNLERSVHRDSHTKENCYAKLNAVRKARLILLNEKQYGRASTEILQRVCIALDKECSNGAQLRPDWYRREYLSGLQEARNIIDQYV